MQLGKALIEIRKAKKLRPKEVYIAAGCSSGEYSQLGSRRSPRDLDRHTKALQVPEAAVLLYAIDENEIPVDCRDIFGYLKRRILQ